MKLATMVVAAVCVVGVTTTARRAAAHGRPAAVFDIVAADEHGPRVVTLSEGLAIRVDSEWRFVCPAEFGSTLPPSALSADGTRTYVVGASDLFSLEPDGSVAALHRPELSRDTVLSLVTTEARLFATRFVDGRTELWRIDDGSGVALWAAAGVYSPLSADASGLWLVTQRGRSARAVRIGLDGTPLLERAFTIDANSSVTTLLALPAALYVTLVTSTLGSKLLLVGETDGGTEAGVSSLVQTDSQISGPSPDESGGAWFASSEQLYRVMGSGVRLVASDQRFSSVGSYQTTSYASLHTKLVELGETGPGRLLFDLAEVRPPLDEALVDARDACNVQWLVFRGDLARAGVVPDGGAVDASASGAPVRPPSRNETTGGCALVVRSSTRSNGARALLLALLSLASVARRRRG